MSKTKLNVSPWVIFAGTTIILAVVFFFFPVELFEARVFYKSGIQEFDLLQNVSLSYYIGIGYTEAELLNVKDVELTWKGLTLAIMLIIGFPALLSYRIHMRSSKEE